MHRTVSLLSNARRQNNQGGQYSFLKNQHGLLWGGGGGGIQFQALPIYLHLIMAKIVAKRLAHDHNIDKATFLGFESGDAQACKKFKHAC